MGEIDSSLNYLEENFSKLEDIAIETIQSETQMNNVSVTLGTKQRNMYVIRIKEREMREKAGQKKYLKKSRL